MEAKKRIRLKVASPCKADWNSMKGDEAIRFCGSCKKSVYRLSNMSAEQVESLLAESGEQKCVRFYQRKDGTLLTEDCFVGLRRKRRKQAVVGAGIGVLSALGVAMAGDNPSTPASGDMGSNCVLEAQPPEIEPAPIPVILEPVPEPPIDDFEYVELMGRIAIEDIPDLEPTAEDVAQQGDEPASVD